MNWPRYFMFTTSALVVGLAIIIFTEPLLTYIEDPGWKGYISLMGYGLVYLNICYGMNRRFIRKVRNGDLLGYILGLLIFLPPAVWVYVKDVGLYNNRTLFLLTLFFACMLGTYYGIRSGYIKQRQLADQQNNSDLPEDLKRPHDNLNRN